MLIVRHIMHSRLIDIRAAAFLVVAVVVATSATGLTVCVVLDVMVVGAIVGVVTAAEVLIETTTEVWRITVICQCRRNIKIGDAEDTGDA